MVDISKMGPLIEQAHGKLAMLSYALGAVRQDPFSAQEETIHDAMRDLTHTVAHMEQALGYG